jgi:hypothetical protein
MYLYLLQGFARLYGSRWLLLFDAHVLSHATNDAYIVAHLVENLVNRLSLLF